MIILSPHVAAQIAAYAEKTYPEECVGLLLGQLEGKDSYKSGEQLFPVENTWDGQIVLADHDNPESRHDRFYLAPRDYLRADRAARAQGLDIVGCYHSHPDHPAIPSERDLVGAQGICGGSAFSFLIQSVYQGKATDIMSWLLVDEPQTETDSKEKRFVQEPLNIE